MVLNNKTIQINNNTKIYIMAPSGVSTGGPEALHQLAYILQSKLKLNVFMYYIPTSNSSSVHPNYKNYSINFIESVEDKDNNILIIPEYFHFLKISKDFKKIQKIIWWLSVDNYLGDRFRFKNLKLTRSFIKVPFNLVLFFNRLSLNFFGFYTVHDYLKFIYRFSNFRKHKELNQAKLHLTQSQYAYDYLKDKIREVDSLSDYIRDDFFENIKFDFKKKEDCICYNPLKSNSFMKTIIKKNKKFKFIPLKGFSKDEVIKVLKKSKIYFDIGSHPGKDRMPREAALLGNCIITNKRGSAFNPRDVSIPNEFKFSENFYSIKKINKKINVIFADYEAEYKKFSPYLDNIYQEKKIFTNQVKKIFQI